ncbi:MAG: hypothetical protein RIR17_950 [Planctomycetota bacterium]|jgi:hypothetical protein
MRMFEKMFASSFLVCVLAFTCVNAQNLDEESVKKVILNEAEYFQNKNFEGWSESYASVPGFLWCVTNGGEPGDVITFRNLEELKSTAKKFIFDNKASVPKTESPKVTNADWNIQIRGDVALVHFRTIIEEAPAQKLETTEMRVLERHNGSWKIVMLTSLWDFKDAVPPKRSSY